MTAPPTATASVAFSSTSAPRAAARAPAGAALHRPAPPRQGRGAGARPPRRFPLLALQEATRNRPTRREVVVRQGRQDALRASRVEAAAAAADRAERVEAAEAAHAAPLPVGRRAALVGATLATMLTGASHDMAPRAGGVLTAQAAAGGDEALYQVLEAAFEKNLAKARLPSALRIVFHDAGTYTVASGEGGANGSIGFELDRPESFGLQRAYRPLEKIQASLVGTPAEKLSMADLIAYGGAHAVKRTGGPDLTRKVRFGRKDAAGPDPEGRLPAETLNPQELKAHFAKMGFNTQELVVISGAHTLGSKGFGNDLTFDNAYYTTLRDNPWAKVYATKNETEMAAMIGLPTDKMLVNDEECVKWINVYAADQALFFKDFERVYLKLSELGVDLA